MDHPFPNIMKATMHDMNIIHWTADNGNGIVTAGCIGYVINQIKKLANGEDNWYYDISYTKSICHPLDLHAYNRKQALDIVTHGNGSANFVNSMMLSSEAKDRSELNNDLLWCAFEPHNDPNLPKWFVRNCEDFSYQIVTNQNWQSKINRQWVQTFKDRNELRLRRNAMHLATPGDVLIKEAKPVYGSVGPTDGYGNGFSDGYSVPHSSDDLIPF